ncbi:MAG: hypothetical protein FWF88_00500 [Peptococcaceae bacterium]|nr:hypothetical protein [Peptococcaceae bacterium]
MNKGQLGQWTMDNGQWTMGTRGNWDKGQGGQWARGNWDKGQWTMDNGDKGQLGNGIRHFKWRIRVT